MEGLLGLEVGGDGDGRVGSSLLLASWRVLVSGPWEVVGQGELACKRCLGEEQVSSQNDPELVRRVKGVLEGRPGGRLAWNPHDKGWLGNPGKLVSGPQAC